MRSLTVDELYTVCDAESLGFETTEELEELETIVGQERAVDAIRFGIDIDQEGFNLFAIGPSGIGKHYVISQFLHDRAPQAPTPDDWIYVHNFEDPRRPRAIRLPSGEACVAREKTDAMILELEAAVRACFEQEDFRARRRSIHHEFDKRHEAALREVDEAARDDGLTLVRTNDGFTFVPIDDDEDAPEPDDEERARLDEAKEALSKTLRAALDKFPGWEKERREALREQEHAAVEAAIAPIFEAVRAEFEDSPDFVAHLEAVEEDVIADPSVFLPNEEDERPRNPFERATRLTGAERYSVNVVIDHSKTVGAPIVYEDDPTVDNLIGRIEYESHYGSLTTNYGLIRPGALHEANGGFLVVDARKLLSDRPAWELLKRALYASQIRIDSGREFQMAPNTLSLIPDPIPLDVKVVLIGERRTYYGLRELDPDVEELFKVMVDFDTEMPRSTDSVTTYSRLIATLVERDDLLPFTAGAVARVIEQSSRVAQDSTRLSTHMRNIADLLRESCHWADGEVVEAEDVQRAIDTQRYRNGRIRSEIARQISDARVVIRTDGEAIGRVNGLSVLSFGQSSFGRPSRISATVAPGYGDVVDIEREVDLGGPIHSKGVMILRGFLAHRYAERAPLALSASIVFEQSYGGVDGDSASVAETCALLSAISEAPIDQAIAVTGAMDQYGHVRAVGGVNEKIEGFFDVCAERGLTGRQGVVIPSANARDLMLRHEVVDAVGRGEFQVWTAEHVDEVLELLCGRSAEELAETVRRRLEKFAEVAREYR